MTTAPIDRLVRRLWQTAVAGTLTDMADAQLLARFQATRDPAAFEAIVRRHGPLVLAACRQVLADDADVDDAFQATFLVLLHDAGKVRRAASLGSWLFGVAHRTALRARVNAARRRRLEALALRPEAAAPP